MDALTAKTDLASHPEFTEPIAPARRSRRVRRYVSGWRYRLALWLMALAERVNPLVERGP